MSFWGRYKQEDDDLPKIYIQAGTDEEGPYHDVQVGDEHCSEGITRSGTRQGFDDALTDAAAILCRSYAVHQRLKK